MRVFHRASPGVSGNHYGKISALRTTKDLAGRVVTSKKNCREAIMEVDLPLEIKWREGRIEIEPATLAVRLVRKGPLLIAVRASNPKPLLLSRLSWPHAAPSRFLNDRSK